VLKRNDFIQGKSNIYKGETMKKVIAFIGSQRKQSTYQAVRELEKSLNASGGINFEYVFLKDYRLEYCKGCKLCFDKGERSCPLEDDRDKLLDKIYTSDGVIFATPNYSFHVSAQMKNFLDRIAFIFHRPCFFGKTYMAIVTQGIFGGGAILKYLSSMGKNLGFNVVKGCCLTTLEPITEYQQKKLIQEVKKASLRFCKSLMESSLLSPSFFRLIMFRMSRTSIMNILDDNNYDYRYFKEKGWFESDYYYNVSLGLIKKSIGRFSDYSAKRMYKNR